MIPKGLFSQLVMIGLAVGIVVTYVQPTLASIQETQADTQMYRVERQKIVAVNALLVSQVSRLDSITALDQRRLLTYLPDQVDQIGISRVIEVIAQQAGVLVKQIRYEGVQDSYLRSTEAALGAHPTPYIFRLGVDGTYPQIKELLRFFEQNEFPLEVHNLTIAVLDGGFLSAELELVTYSNQLPAVSQFNQ